METLKTGFEFYTETPLEKQKMNKGNLVSLIRGGEKLLYIPKKTEEENHGEYIDLMQTRARVYERLLNTPSRKEKYQNFLITLGKFRLYCIANKLPRSSLRAEAMDAIYIGMRILDDIVDGDSPEILTPEDRVSYIQQRIQSIEGNDFDVSDPVDAFLSRAFMALETLGLAKQSREPLGAIIRSMLFDVKRIQYFENKKKEGKFEPQKFTKKELEKHFHGLDIDGTIGESVLLFGQENDNQIQKKLTPLGRACRVSYNIGYTDLRDDLRQGLCNIPMEDLLRLNILDEDLCTAVEGGVYPSNICTWVQEQVNEGRQLLEEHYEITKENVFNRNMKSPSQRMLRKLDWKVFEDGYCTEVKTILDEAKGCFVI